MRNHHTTSGDQKHHHTHEHGPIWKRLHRDWRVWVVVGLMLVAMMMYVLTDDESLQPGGGPARQPMPAATGL